MAQYRSYASPGQFVGGIKVPDKATAKRQEDKEFVQELKQQDKDLSERDATLLAALKRKYEKESAARNLVEKTRREGVAAEKAQREKNAKLEADFAEMKMKADAQVWETMAELIPSIGENIIQAKENRKKYNADQAYAALDSAGMDAEQWREFESITLTSDQFSSGKQGWLVHLRDNRKIEYPQYLDMMNGVGGWGLGTKRGKLVHLSRNFPAWLIANGNKPLDDHGTTLNQALTSTDLTDNKGRSGIVEAEIARYKREVLGDFNPAFIAATVPGLELEFNRLRNQAAKTGLKQSEELGIELDEQAVFGDLNAGAVPRKYASITDSVARDAYFRLVIKHAQTLLKEGKITEEQMGQLFSMPVYTKAKPNTPQSLEKAFPGRYNELMEAITARQKRLNEMYSVQQTEKKYEDNAQLEEKLEYIGSLPLDQQAEAIERELMDPNNPQAVKAGLNTFANNGETIRNDVQIRQLQRLEAAGIPFTREKAEQMNLKGSAARYGAELLKRNLPSAEFEKTAKSSIRNWVNGATGRESEFDSGHDQSEELQRKMLRDYRARRQAYINTGNLGPEAAHQKALEDLHESFKAGIDEENPAPNDHPYKFRPNPENPLAGKFINISGSGYNVEKTPLKSIAKLHDKYGDNLDKVPNTIFTNTDEMSRTWIHSKTVTQKDWNRAIAVSEATGTETDTHVTVMLNQWKANMDQAPPAWLVEAEEAHKQALNLGISKNTLNKIRLPGERLDILKMRAFSDIKSSTYPTYTGDRDNQETGTDVVFNGGLNAPLVLNIPARMGEPEDGYPAVHTESDTGGKSFGHTVSVIVTLPNGNEVDFFIGHLHEPSPLAGFNGIIPAGTRLGGQGMSGSTSGVPVATMHANGRNGYIATPEDLMWIIRNMQGISGGTQQPQQRQIKPKQVVDEVPIQPSGNIDIEDVQAIDPLNTPTQLAQAVNDNEIMQEWLRKVSGMPLPPLLQGGYGK